MSLRTANIEVSLQRLSILRIEHPQANPLKLSCTLRAGETLPSGLTITAEIHTSRNVAAETTPLASSTVTVAADATSFDVLFDSPQTNQTVTPDSTRALWLVVYGVGDADQLYTFAAADLLLGWHAISTVTPAPPATAVLVEKGGVAWATARAYAAGTMVTVGTTAYVASSAHTSGSTTQPGTGASWNTVWTVLSGGGGGTVTLTGDVTGSGTGTFAATIATDAVTTAKILNGAVTVAKTSGFGTIATQPSSAVAITGGSITGITDLAIADGGTGASNAATALSNLGAYPASNPSGFTSNTGTVTAVSVTTANGVSGTSSGGATPALTITLGAITPTSVNGIAFSGSSTPTLAVTGTTSVSGTNTGNVSLAASLTDILALSSQQLQGVTEVGADRILFFDHSASKYTFLTVSTGLTITGTTLTSNFVPASPGAIGGTTPSTAVFTSLDVRTELDVQSTSGAAGAILSWNTGVDVPTNWERASLAWSSNVFNIGTQRNGTGVAREIEIQPGGVTAARFTTDGRATIGTATPASAATSVTVGTASAALGTSVTPSGQPSGVVVSRAGPFTFAAESTLTSGSGGGAVCGLYSNDGAAMASSDRLGGFLFGGSSSASALRNTCAIFGYATESWTDASAFGSGVALETTANGSTVRSVKVWINGDGNVGIGANVFSVAVQPTSRLQIRGAGTTTGVAILVENSSGTARFTVRDDGAFAFAGGTVAAAETGWTTFTNLTTDRTCDANATTVEELADILGTLIVALKNKGIIAN